MSWFKKKEKPPEEVHDKQEDGTCSCEEDHWYISSCRGCGKWQETNNYNKRNFNSSTGPEAHKVLCWSCRMRRREVEALEKMASQKEEE